jgi:hypothetical protein
LLTNEESFWAQNVSDILKRYSGFIILILLAALVFSPIEVPFSVDSVAKALPARQWILFKGLDGSLTATLHDHRSGVMKGAEGYQFDRGDLVQMHFNESWQSGTCVRAGEKVATITSNFLNERLVQLKNLLAIEQANLNILTTGEKQQIIKQLEEGVNLAKENLLLQQKNKERAELLIKDGLISQMELDIAQNAYEQAIIQIRLAEKALEVGATGEKQEAIALSQSTIDSYKKEIAFLEARQNQYVITAPFEGVIRFESGLDGERLYVEDTSAFVFFIPIRFKDSRYVQPGQQMDLRLLDTGMTVSSTIMGMDSKVHLLLNEPEAVVIARAVVTEGKEKLPSGMPLRCRVYCGNVRLKEFLRRSIQWE